MLDKFKNMGWKKFYLIYAMCTIETMATRFLPFMIFNEKRTTPKYITYLGKVFQLLSSIEAVLFTQEKLKH